MIPCQKLLLLCKWLSGTLLIVKTMSMKTLFLFMLSFFSLKHFTLSSFCSRFCSVLQITRLCLILHSSQITVLGIPFYTRRGSNYHHKRNSPGRKRHQMTFYYWTLSSVWQILRTMCFNLTRTIGCPRSLITEYSAFTEGKFGIWGRYCL